MRRLISLLLLLLPVCSKGENWQLDWYSSARMAGGTGEYMPFFARTGEDGILPVTSSALATLGADLHYEHANGIYFQTGANIAGAAAYKSPLNADAVYGLVDRLYVSGGWKMLHLDLGMKPRERELSDLSISGGNIMYSRNARNMPGINAWSDWIYFDRGHRIAVKGNISHYQTIDDRHVKGAMIHNKSLALKVGLGKTVDLSLGLDHWAQWGGNSKKVTFGDYLRIFLAGRGDESATLPDQVNVLGNHLGREFVRVDWRHQAFTMTFQYDKPFEDKSGIEYRNAPDGVWSLQFAFKDRDAYVTDLILEYINTTWQTGPYHDRPATEEEKEGQDKNDYYFDKIVLGGRDNYFAHFTYKSGWTYHGRQIGLPLILQAKPDADGVVRNTVSTRVRGCNVGVRGVIAGKLPYSFRAVYTANYGVYHQKEDSFFVSVPQQFSVAADFTLDNKILRLPLGINIGAYADFGQIYRNSVGLSLKVFYNGLRRF